MTDGDIWPEEDYGHSQTEVIRTETVQLKENLGGQFPHKTRKVSRGAETLKVHRSESESLKEQREKSGRVITITVFPETDEERAETYPTNVLEGPNDFIRYGYLTISSEK